MAKHNLTIADIDAHVGGKKRRPKPGTNAAVATEASAAKEIVVGKTTAKQAVAEKAVV